MIKGIIFDLGGVILNRGLWLFREYLVNTYNISNEETINIFIKKNYKPYFSGKISEQEFWESALKDLNIKDEWIGLKNILLNFYETKNEMIDLLKKLKKMNYTLTLLSDQTNEWWDYLNSKYHIKNYFDYCFISSEIGLHKPEPEIYNYCLSKIKFKPDECIFIDDLERNLIPAKKIGINTIHYKNSEQCIKELYKLIKINNFETLKND